MYKNNKNALLAILPAILLVACGGGGGGGSSDPVQTTTPTVTDRDGDGIANDADLLPDNPYVAGAVTVSVNFDYLLGNSKAESSYRLGIAAAGLDSADSVADEIASYTGRYPYSTNGLLLGYNEFSNSTGAETERTVLDYGNGDLIQTVTTTSNSVLQEKWTYSYDADDLDEINKDTDGDGSAEVTEEYRYDGNGRLDRIATRNASTGAIQATRTFEYYASGNVRYEYVDTDYSGSPDITYYYEYNANGQLVLTTTTKASPYSVEDKYFVYENGRISEYRVDKAQNGTYDIYEKYDGNGRITDKYTGYNNGSFTYHQQLSYRTDGQVSGITYDCDGDTATDDSLNLTYSNSQLTDVSYLSNSIESWYADISWSNGKATLVSLYDSSDDSMLQATRYQYDSNGRVSERARNEDDMSEFIFTHKYSYEGTVTAMPVVDVLSDLDINDCD